MAVSSNNISFTIERTSSLNTANSSALKCFVTQFAISSTGVKCGYDCFRIIGDNEAIFLDYAGSGNRTARDIENDGEVTVVFCSFSTKLTILRLFCKDETINCGDEACRSLFDPNDLRGMRRFVKLHIYCVEHSCDKSVPFYKFKGERTTIKNWCAKDSDNGKVDEYIADHANPLDLSEFRHW